MDLTTQVPRSPFAKLEGYIFLPRVIDKARAFVAGTLGEYNFKCPMDLTFFGFWGVDPEAFVAEVRAGKDDEALAEWFRTQAKVRTVDDVKAYRIQLLETPPSDPEKLAYLKSYQEQVAPGRSELDSFAKVIAVEENHPLPSFTRTAPLGME